jgi:hypothetical protein
MSASDSYERQILEETPEKVLPFLRAIATRVEIRVAMLGAGYTAEEQAYGWKLLLDVSGHAPAALPPGDDERARAAIAELDAWDESGFRRIHAALGRLHPEQDAFVFAGVGPGHGVGAVISVATLLDRLDALEKSPDRSSTRDADQAAMATLAKRGIDAALRQHLRELVAVAQTARLPTTPEPAEPSEDQRQETLKILRAWYKDWSETAHAMIRRRDHLVLMGLAKRKAPVHDDPPNPTPAPNADGPSPVTPAVSAA